MREARSKEWDALLGELKNIPWSSAAEVENVLAKYERENLPPIFGRQAEDACYVAWQFDIPAEILNFMREKGVSASSLVIPAYQMSDLNGKGVIGILSEMGYDPSKMTSSGMPAAFAFFKTECYSLMHEVLDTKKIKPTLVAPFSGQSLLEWFVDYLLEANRDGELKQENKEGLLGVVERLVKEGASVFPETSTALGTKKKQALPVKARKKGFPELASILETASLLAKHEAKSSRRQIGL